jgi:dipeptidyl aminopeptidase/acylaminoacyl peptidase
MLKVNRILNIFTIFIFLAVLNVQAQDSNVLTPYNIVKLKSIGETVLSPDGNLIAYTLISPRALDDESGTAYRELYVIPFSGGESKPFVTGKISIGNLAFSPDGKLITFTGRFDNDKTTQVYAIPVDGGEKYKITNVKESISSYKIHPNGKLIYYTATAPIDEKKKSLEKKGFNAIVYEENWQHINLYKYDIETKESKQLTKDITVWEITLSPDGKTIAAAVSPRNSVDDSYMFKRIHLVNPETGAISLLIDNPGKLGNFKFSPDGKNLVINSAVDISDPASSSMYVVSVPNPGMKFSDLKNYSLNFEGTVSWVGWKDNNTMLFLAEEGVYLPLSSQTIDGKPRKLISDRTAVIRSVTYSSKGDKYVMVMNTPNHTNEIYTFSGNTKPKRLTNSNPWLDEIKFGKQEEIRYSARDRLEITGILIYPLNYEAGKKYPLIVDIHGGPEAAYQNGWVTGYGNWGQIASARGYFVFLPNYRASNGRGVEFSKMGHFDLGGKEFDDVLDGIDFLIEKGLVDPDRVGIGGGSYGGYFSAWAATKHSHRFAAACVFVGISNQISKRGTTDIPLEDYYVHWTFWAHDNYDHVWDRSPLKWAKQNQTPTLILHGKDDPRVNVAQSMELYRALKNINQAPVRLILYPGEGHGNARTPARLDYAIRTIEWFDFYVKDKKPKIEIPSADIDYGVN